MLIDSHCHLDMFPAEERPDAGTLYRWLRRAVQEYLKDHPLVQSFATANADEGGAGATTVVLKET